jgi:hypothetical protein
MTPGQIANRVVDALRKPTSTPEEAFERGEASGIHKSCDEQVRIDGWKDKYRRAFRRKNDDGLPLFINCIDKGARVYKRLDQCDDAQIIHAVERHQVQSKAEKAAATILEAELIQRGLFGVDYAPKRKRRTS